MDDRKIRKALRDATGQSKLKISENVLHELRKAPIDLYENLPEHEKTIAITAFMAAAGAMDAIENNRSELDAYSVLELGERRTLTGLIAAAAALRRIPAAQRSSVLNSILDRCGCSPNPELPDGNP